MKTCLIYSLSVASLAFCSQNTAGEIASPGPPPLMRSVLDKIVHLVEWQLEIRLTPDERREFEQMQIGKWNGLRAGRESLLDLAHTYDQVQRLSSAAKDDARGRFGVYTSEEGKFEVTGSSIVVQIEKGTILSKDNCNVRFNYQKPMSPRHTTYAWRLQREPSKLTLCITKSGEKEICTTKK